MNKIIADPYDEFDNFDTIGDGSWETDTDANKLRYLAGYFDEKDRALGITDRTLQEDLERIASYLDSQVGEVYVCVGRVQPGRRRVQISKLFNKRGFARYVYMREHDA